jgi:hypothetical protein
MIEERTFSDIAARPPLAATGFGAAYSYVLGRVGGSRSAVRGAAYAS